ncbi:MAG: protein-methionine-sulfoxide reductase heme-binding subunit MsrQ [Alphaproteobacteria bacterium]|nr:protein-methionine-sulfoxide reductase heme-binding subunit MsrQ [Alphaproteobacteria bacterium]MDI9329859.1 protein-methionine-sulfoxide reductase heme-binding subunit MsrQ [Alphaproteobacteria bacterium]
MSLVLRPALRRPWAKPLLAVFLAMPMVYLVWGAAIDALGANPAEALIRSTGEMALRCLCLALAVTPLRVLSGWTELARFRRMIGLFAFGYAFIHLLCYGWLDMGLDVADIAIDIAKRPFILVGMLTFVLLLSLAATSFNAAIRRMGAKRWQLLHRLVYLSALLALLHFYWKRAGKNNFDDVWVYAAIVTILLGWRIWHRWRGPVRSGV